MESISINAPCACTFDDANFISKYVLKNSFSSLRLDSDSLVYGSKGNHFRSRMSTIYARPKFGSFPIVSFDFEGVEKSRMRLYKL